MVLLEKEFKEYGLPLNRHIREGKMDHICRFHKNQEFEHVLFCIGEGSIRIEEVLSWFEIKQKNLLKTNYQKEKLSKNNEQNPLYSKNFILVDGMKNVMTRIARCCSPNENQPIMGYLTKEKIISVHKEICPFLKKSNPERIIKVNWSKINK